MAYKNPLEEDNFTENERVYIDIFHSIGASIPPREVTIFRPPILTRNDLLKTILWRKAKDSSYYLANQAVFTNPSLIASGKQPYLYDDSSYPFWKLNTEKEFSDTLTSFLNSYLPVLQTSLLVPEAPTTNINEVFLRHYAASIQLLLDGPPNANNYKIETELADEWIAAHKTPEHRRLAKLLLENTIYISHAELLKEIQRSIEKIQEKLVPGLPIIFLTGPENKSNYYISLLFYHFWKEAGLTVTTFKVYMDEIVEGNIIDIDEMAYSGTQTTGTLAGVYAQLVSKMIKNIVELNCKETMLESFCKSRNFYPLAIFEQILHEKNVNYIVVRIFCSEKGEKELLRFPHGSYTNPLKFPSHLVIGRKIPSPESLFGKANATKLSILYGSEPGLPAATVYFNHKIANRPSTFLFPYAYGVVPDKPLLTQNNFWTMSKEEQKEFNNAYENLQSPTNTNDVEFKPFIQYCQPGFRKMPRHRKNLLNYSPPNRPSGFSMTQAELPQEYRCPYAWYKRINYETGTYTPLPLPTISLPYGPQEANFVGGKTRRNRNQKHRKTRKQKGGAGFFSMLSKPTSSPSSPPPYESYLSSINRVYTFLYSKLKPTTPGYIPLKSGQTKLTSEQKDYFRSLLDEYTIQNSNERTTYRDEDFVKNILGVESVTALTREIQAVEAAGTPVQDIILNRPSIAQSFAGSWGRSIPFIYSSDKQLEYRQNWEQHICRFDYKVDSNRPILSLEENRCVVVYFSKDKLESLEAEFELVYGNNAKIGVGFPSLQVEQEFMPIMDGQPFPYTRIQASKLMKTSYVLDAFINNAVKEIQPNLAATIEKENKRLWNQYSLVKVVNHRNFARHDIYMQKFISVADEFPVKEGTYFLLPNLSSLHQVKGMDVQSSLQLRTRYPSIWASLGPDPNLDFFQGLKYIEQIEFAVLQFKQYVKVVATNPINAFRTVYLSDLRVPETKELFLQNIDAESFQTYRNLLNRHR